MFKKNTPASVDGAFVVGKWIYFVEIKSGYKNLVSEKNIDMEKLRCPYKENQPCEKNAQLLVDENKWLCKVLKTNIQLKAAESYRTFEKKIVPSIKDTDSDRRYCTCFIAVIDQDKMSGSRATYGPLQYDYRDRTFQDETFINDEQITIGYYPDGDSGLAYVAVFDRSADIYEIMDLIISLEI